MLFVFQLRPPQPAVYLFLLDVSFNAIETGLLIFCHYGLFYVFLITLS